MKFFIGALALIAATPTWANGCATDPSYGYGCGAGYSVMPSTPYATQPSYGTSTRIITGHDGARSVEIAPSYGAQDEVRVIDYSGDYITEDVIDQYGVHELD